MIATSSSLLWYTTRASGIVSLLLLTAVMVGGIMTATRVGGGTVPRFAVAEIHRRISLIAMVFIALHIITTLLDTYVNVSPLAALVPFASQYKPLKVALGAVAFDLLLAITISSLVRQKLSHSAWRAIHWISYLAFPIAVLHEALIGTDFRFAWMILLSLVCVGTVAVALAWRFWAHPRPDGALTAVPARTAPPKRSKAIINRTPATKASPGRHRGSSSTKRRP
ncbi:MAG: ferric reductase-like transmembrane domain-containing protein [Actinomycetes bacterium]